MHKVGRNDPCPCGSGKKYKKCHGDDTQPSLEKDVKRCIDMDHRLLSQLADFGAKQLKNQGWDPFFLEPEDAHDHVHGEHCDHDHMVMFADVSFPLSMYSQEIDGKTVADHFLATKGKYTGAEDKKWMEAQKAAVFSVWQLESLGDGSNVRLKNRIDDSELTVVDADLAAHGHKGELFLGRVVTLDGMPILTAMHREIVREEDADEVVSMVKAQASHAPGFEAQKTLVQAWHDAVYDEEDAEEGNSPAEALQE